MTNGSRQCDSLEDDVLLDLDVTAKELQKVKFRYTRSGEYERVLLSLYPDLKERLIQERRSKIDSIVLLNKYSESLPKGVSSFRAGSFNQYSDQIALYPKRRQSHGGMSNPSSTPTLPGRALPSSDMIFEMEDDEASEVSTPSKTPLDIFSPPPPVSPTVWPVSTARGKQRAVSDGNLSKSSLDPTSTSESSPNALVWEADRPFANDKLTLRDIMEQASASRLSNLTSGLNARSVSGSVAHTKLSQKERKKLQQEASLKQTSAASIIQSTTSRGSPWKIISKAKVRTPDLALSPSSPSTPQLTMRQTIANPGSKTSQPKSTIKQTPPSRPQKQTTPSSTPIVEIKSVRHTPMPIRSVNPTEFASLTDILLQQQADKLKAQGGGEKHYLADIQTEQQFQQWWELESARVQEEEKAQVQRDQKAKSRKKSNRYRGKSHANKSKERGTSTSSHSAPKP